MKNKKNSMQIKKSSHKRTNKTLWLASFAVISVLGAFVASRLSNVVDLKKIERNQQLVDKKPVYHQIPPEINKIDFRIPESLVYPMKVTFKFTSSGTFKGSSAVDSEAMANATKKAIKNKGQGNKIEIKQVIDEKYLQNGSVYKSNGFKNIDLNKIDWNVVNNTLTIDLSASIDFKEYYYGEELLVTLPRDNVTISTSPKLYNSLYFESIGEPVNVHVLAKGAKFSGNYANLTISQTNECNSRSDQCFVINNDTSIDNLVVYSDFKGKVDNKEAKNEYTIDSDELELPFSLTIGHNAQLNSADFYMPKEAKIEMYNLALVNKVNWHLPKSDKSADETVDELMDKTVNKNMDSD